MARSIHSAISNYIADRRVGSAALSPARRIEPTMVDDHASRSKARSREARQRLPVGPIDSDGAVTQVEELSGHKIAFTMTEGSRVVWPLPERAKVRVERTLYQLEGHGGFAVHAVACSGSQQRPVLARVVHYQHWSDVEREHPDLARAASLSKIAATA